jgi:glutamine synthetase
VIRAVHKYAGVLRGVIATASNDFRLGANEAPPAIISVFLGEQLSDIFDQIKAGGAKSSKMKSTLEIGVDTLPKLPRDPGDRNRTSPFAFTGNRFEFRAVGSSQSISDPLVALNTAIAESCDYIATKMETALASGKKLNAVIQEILGEIITQHGAVIFNGNGYSAEWHAEAEKRGLPNYKTAVDALPVLQKPEVIALFDKYKVLSPRELSSRYETYVEQYNKSVNVEANLCAKIAKTSILPAALRYQSVLAENVNAVKAAGLVPDTVVLKQVTDLIGKLQTSLATLATAAGHHGAESPLAEAKHFCNEVLPSMLKVREAADGLEAVVDDEIWPLPTYQEILFIK